MGIKTIFKGLNTIKNKPGMVKKYIIAKLSYIFCGFLKGRAQFPMSIAIQINSKCNLNCRMCDVGLKNSQSMYYQNSIVASELTIEQWKRFVSKVAAYKPNIFIPATEPLLHKQIIEFIDFIAKKNKLNCEINTNGFFLKEHAQALIGAGLKSINISIDGPEKIHDQVRGAGGSFLNAMAGIKEVLKHRNPGGNPKVNIYYTISDLNYSYLNETIKTLDDNRINYDQMLFAHLLFIDDKLADLHNKSYPHMAVTSMNSLGKGRFDIDTARLKDEIARIKSGPHNEKIIFFPDMNLNLLDKYYFNTHEFIKNQDKCELPWFFVTIRADGEAMILPRCYGKGFGNILKDSLESIWNSKGIKEFRVNLKKDKAFTACSRCCGVFHA